HGDDDRAEGPLAPSVVQDGGHHRDDLDDGLKLAQVAGFDGEALGGGDGAQAVDQKLAPDNEHHDPWLYYPWVERDQNDIGGGDHELVGQWVQQHAQSSDLPSLA